MPVLNLKMEIELTKYIWVLWLLVPLVIWEVIWKIIGMWKSARNNQLAWFICIAILNTIGLLPIIYIVWFQDEKKNTGDY